MLKKKQKLSRREFENLTKKGKRVYNKDLSLVYLPQKETKCGLVVSKKTAKKAVVRNLLRRKIFSILQRNIYNIKNTHLAIYTRPKAVNLSYQELQKSIEELLSAIKQ